MIKDINFKKFLSQKFSNFLLQKNSPYVKTGFPSIDRPWDKSKKEIEVPDTSIYECLLQRSSFNACNQLSRCHEDVLTMDKLKKETEEYAKSFKAIGIKKGDIVPICMQPNNEGIVAFFALNRIGAVPTFLNATANINEIESYIRKFNSNVLITSSKFVENTDEIIKDCNLNKAIVISPRDSFKEGMQVSELTSEYIDLFDKKFEENDKKISLNTFKNIGKDYTGKIDEEVKAKDVAFISFTSGSTGEPKAIVLTNENIIAEMLSLKKTTHMNIGPKGNSLQVVPFNYPYGFLISTLFPMFVGKTAALTPMITLKTVVTYLEMYLPPYIQAIPSFYSSLQLNESAKDLNLSFLKYPVSGGDTLDITSKNQNNEFYKKHGSRARIKDGSGNGEGCGCLTTSVVLGKENQYSVGKPIAGLNVKIVDPETDVELEFGKVGRFCFSGKNVMLEYYNDPEKTNEVKKTDKNGVEWFYTDTYAHMDSKGWLYIDGRDRRFFITYDQEGSPYKVYCDYVQSILKECSEVFDCAVVKKPDDVRSYIAKAFIVLKENVEYTKELEEKIKLICGSQLQSCAIPEEYEVVAELPLTRAEKIDYTLLEKQCADEYEDNKGKKMIKRNELHM